MKHWHCAALAALLLAPRLALAQPEGPAPVRPARPAVAQPARPGVIPPGTPAQSRPVRMGSFEVWVVTDYFTGELRSTAAVRPRGTRLGELRWSCAEGGGLWVGVILSGIGRDGETRPVEWRFDGDAPATASLRGVTDYRRWFLPAEDVAPFTQRARTAQTLAIRVPNDGAEYVYELEGPGEALDQLACARGTPVAGRIPQSLADFNGVGRSN